MTDNEKKASKKKYEPPSITGPESAGAHRRGFVPVGATGCSPGDIGSACADGSDPSGGPESCSDGNTPLVLNCSSGTNAGDNCYNGTDAIAGCDTGTRVAGDCISGVEPMGAVCDTGTSVIE